jgi:hypothetical protein
VNTNRCVFILFYFILFASSEYVTMIPCLRLMLVVVVLMALVSIFFSSTLQQEQDQQVEETVVDDDILVLEQPIIRDNKHNDNDATRKRNVVEGNQQLLVEPTILHHKNNDGGTHVTPPKNTTTITRRSPQTNYYNATIDDDSLLLCRSPECFKLLAANASLSRAFPDRTNHTWIILTRNKEDAVDFDLGNNNNYTVAGILYVKNFKAASSTAAGAALRIAAKYGNINGTIEQQQRRTRTAWVKVHHTPGHSYRLRDPQRSILITSVRDPAARALSRIFYSFVSRWGASTDDAYLLRKLQTTDPQFGVVSHTGGGFQVKYVSMQPRLSKSWTPANPTKVLDPHSIQSAVRQIFKDYDFILVAERMDESLVAMALLLGVSITDVLIQSAKQSTALQYHYFKHGKREHCTRPKPAFRSTAVQAYLESPEWYAKNYGDYLLHAATHISLNRTIERLGVVRFSRSLHEYRRLKSKAEQRCANQTVYHCSVDGKPQRHLSKLNCYSDDSGCGYPCIDKMLLDEHPTQ